MKVFSLNSIADKSIEEPVNINSHRNAMHCERHGKALQRA